MTAVLAHLDVPPLLSPPLLVLLAGAAVLLPGRLTSDRTRPRPVRPVAAPLTANPTATGAALLVLTVAALWAVASAPRPGPALAWVWLTVTVASLALGRAWQVGNPLRLLARTITRLVDPDDAGVAAAPGRLPGAAAAAGLFVLGWLQHAPLPSGAVAGALGVYLALHLLAGLTWGAGWFARGDAVEVYSTLVADSVRPPGGAAAPASNSELAALAALLAVPLHARIAAEPAWLELTADAAGREGDLAAVGLLAGLGVLAFTALRAVNRGVAVAALAPAVVGVFASHQLALLLSAPLALQDELTAGDPLVVAATLVPLLALLAGAARASHRLHRLTRALPTRQARATRVPALALLGVLTIAAALLWAVPL